MNPRKLAVAALVPLGLVAAMPAAASASEDSTQTNGCVTTTVARDDGYVMSITVRNACSYTLNTVSAHYYNGPAGIDRRSACCYNVGSGQTITYGFLIGWDGPKGSLTCGEIWGPNSKLWGRDCRSEP